MPMLRVGYGIITAGMVACTAMLVVSLTAGYSSSAVVVPAILGFAASVVGGVLTIVGKLEKAQEAMWAVSRAVREVGEKAASRLEARDDDSAVRLKENTDLTRQNSDKLDVVAVLVNNQTRIALETILRQAERIAQLTGDPNDRAAAEFARRKLEHHDAQQKKVDDAASNVGQAGGGE